MGEHSGQKVKSLNVEDLKIRAHPRNLRSNSLRLGG
jgi:hypothetical protein